MILSDTTTIPRSTNGFTTTTIKHHLPLPPSNKRRKSAGKVVPEVSSPTLPHQPEQTSPPGRKQGKKEKVKTQGVDVKYYDVGGGEGIRGIWSNYFAETHACIYMVDASDFARLPAAAEALSKVMHDERMTGKPFLIIANKQDSTTAQALTPEQLYDSLNLNELAPWSRPSPTTGTPRSSGQDEESVCVVKGVCGRGIVFGGKDADVVEGMRDALTRFLATTTHRLPSLATRVQTDSAEQSLRYTSDLASQKQRVDSLRSSQKSIPNPSPPPPAPSTQPHPDIKGKQPERPPQFYSTVPASVQQKGNLANVDQSVVETSPLFQARTAKLGFHDAPIPIIIESIPSDRSLAVMRNEAVGTGGGRGKEEGGVVVIAQQESKEEEKAEEQKPSTPTRRDSREEARVTPLPGQVEDEEEEERVEVRKVEEKRVEVVPAVEEKKVDEEKIAVMGKGSGLGEMESEDEEGVEEVRIDEGLRFNVEKDNGKQEEGKSDEVSREGEGQKEEVAAEGEKKEEVREEAVKVEKVNPSGETIGGIAKSDLGSANMEHEQPERKEEEHRDVPLPEEDNDIEEIQVPETTPSAPP
ncbi:ADP-ribosylation factor-like protein 13B, partial [Rhizophlyctis rosea]